LTPDNSIKVWNFKPKSVFSRRQSGSLLFAFFKIWRFCSVSQLTCLESSNSFDWSGFEENANLWSLCLTGMYIASALFDKISDKRTREEFCFLETLNGFRVFFWEEWNDFGVWIVYNCFKVWVLIFERWWELQDMKDLVILIVFHIFSLLLLELVIKVLGTGICRLEEKCFWINIQNMLIQSVFIDKLLLVSGYIDQSLKEWNSKREEFSLFWQKILTYQNAYQIPLLLVAL
jgi:hypothetical protein